MAAGISANDQPGALARTDERTPLLAKSSVASAQQGELDSHAEHADGNGNCEEDDEDVPMPLRQILILCTARFIEPIAFFSIVPYINQMVKDNSDLTKEQVATYSGLIESLFSLTQMVFMVQYGRASDYFGRKPILVWSLAGLTVTTSIFGTARAIWQMILFRCLSGCFAGVVVTVRTMISENCTKKTQAGAFSIFSVVSNMGIFVGPLIGGALAAPARQYPNSFFSKIQFFCDYPYALPSFTVGFLAAVALLIQIFFAKETLRRSGDGNRHDSEAPTPVMELLKNRDIAIVLGIYSGVQLLGLSYTALVPSFAYVPVQSGGLGFDEIHISAILAIAGLAQTIWMLFVFTPLQHRTSTGYIYRWSLRFWPVFMLSYPITNLIARRGWETGAQIFLYAIVIPIGSGVAMGFTAGQLTINDIAPTPQSLGTLNGISLAIGSGIRAVGPAAINGIFSIGVQYQILWGLFAWVFIVGLAIANAIFVESLPAKAEGDLRKQSKNEAAAENRNPREREDEDA